MKYSGDVVKALAFGAKAVLIGRAYLWGLAAFGQDGVAGVLTLLQRALEFFCNVVRAEFQPGPAVLRSREHILRRQVRPDARRIGPQGLEGQRCFLEQVP